MTCRQGVLVLKNSLDLKVIIDMNIEDAFKKFVRYKNKAGHHYDCILGNFGVFSSNREEAEQEARYYFAQYWSDGDYDYLIGEGDEQSN